jgi:hypothetical protein
MKRTLSIFAFLFCLFFGNFSFASTNPNIQKFIQNEVPTLSVPELQSTSFKYIAKSETYKKSKSHRHEFFGVKALRNIFGDEKQEFDATFVYISDSEKITDTANCTWYINKYPSGGTGSQLYYRTNEAVKKMNEGDLLLVNKIDKRNLFIAIIDKKSKAKDRILAVMQSGAMVKPAPKESTATEPAEPIIAENTKGWIQVYFTPSKDCENNIIQRIEKSKKLDIAVYAITNRAIVDAILAAKTRGAKIRIITDRLQAAGKGSLVGELESAGLSVRTNIKHKIEHNKFAVFDDKEIVSGSYNWTDNASNKNSENCLFFRQPDTRAFTKRFQYLWDFYGD